jgi:hypothetical protein
MKKNMNIPKDEISHINKSENVSSSIGLTFSKPGIINLNILEKQFEPNEEEVIQQYNPFHIEKIQNYKPIYNLFFELNENNYNDIGVNQCYHMQDLKTIIDLKTNEKLQKDVFIKFSPLLEPIRYMIGKYTNKVDGSKTNVLPKLSIEQYDNEEYPNPKILETNNASYVDSFFNYLSSLLLHQYGFINGLDYYGSYLGIQEKYKFDISNDFEYLINSEFFNENMKKMFSISENSYFNEFMNYGSRSNKIHIEIKNTELHNISSISIIDLENNNEINNENQELPSELELESSDDCHEIYENSNIIHSTVDEVFDSDSVYNYTTDEESIQEEVDEHEEKDNNSNGEDGDDSDDENWETESDEDTNDSESVQNIYINDYPIQMICLEKCEGTLNSLFENNDFKSINEKICCMFQIIMILITYKKAFHMTHNDLHTNNIMYIRTNQKYIYYKYDDNIYKIRTYGKIYKIIDFGRSIYKFKGQQFCSNSFSPDGDASTQYNFEPYYNEKKPRIEPNFSFDLCRLACSIYDFIIDEHEKIENMDEFQRLIYKWCTDDTGRNILYKRNGEERYPNFKIYIMIARTVHNIEADKEIKTPIFNKFIVDNYNSIENLVNIDSIPSLI